MTGITAIIGWIFCAAAVAGALYAIACAFAVQRFANAKIQAGPPVPVTVLKPLYGAEPQLAENLTTFCRQDYAAPVQLVLGMHQSDDGAFRIAQSIKAANPALDVALVAGSARHGANPKISNLLNMLPAAKHDLLVISDSDIAVPPHYLAVVAAAVQMPGTGVVTCCYTGRPAVTGLWPRLSAMGINQHFLPDVLFALAHGFASPCFGSTIALKRSVLDEIGGLQTFADRLADDYEIGRAVRSLGYRLNVPPLIVSHSCAEMTPGDVFRHELRWARTIRLVNPSGFAGSIVTHAIPLSLIGCLVLAFAPAALGVLAAAIAARVWLAIHINTRFGTADPIWLVPARDLLSFMVFIGALFAGRVDWRGARFQVSSAGAIAQD
ncbi:MAG TPA: bacteriohopanetetrol glucosamine biosynthesis glycosyltransferase HpnI [Micropepsaceae bacterium]|nr:bacteriohopanetetrol glucosamine biosynthesis glycosyltransferase HpnI [Micropepsaceae bacterium]